MYGEHMLEKDLHKATSLDVTCWWALMEKHLEMLLQWVTFLIESRQVGKKI